MPIGIVTQLFINNEFVNSVDGKTFPATNPANEKVLAEMQEAGKADVDRAVDAARKAFDEGPWKDFYGFQRRDAMLKLADLIEKNADELADIESQNNGKPKVIARAVDLNLTVAVIRYYAGWADKTEGKSIPTSGPFLAYTRHEPVGVCAQIIPWNFPLVMLAWKLGPALAMGCTIVLKSSEKTPMTALMVASLVKEAGFPPGVINILSGYGPTCGSFMAQHMKVDKVAFTGSTAVGRLIQKYAAESNLKKVTLELGGKSPLIVCADADLDKAVLFSQMGMFFNAGQVCSASSRIFVHEDVYDKFIEKTIEATKKQVVTQPEDPTCTVGPIVDKIQFDKVMGYIEHGKKDGAQLLAGGLRQGDRGYFIQPTVFGNVTDDMKIAREEIFGPVMSVIKFKTLDEAIKRANATDYGLGAGILTSNITTALKAAHQLKAGTVYINCYHKFDPAVPFGGFKASGIGRELGEYGLAAYTEVKSVFIPLED